MDTNTNVSPMLFELIYDYRLSIGTCMKVNKKKQDKMPLVKGIIIIYRNILSQYCRNMQFVWRLTCWPIFRFMKYNYTKVTNTSPYYERLFIIHCTNTLSFKDDVRHTVWTLYFMQYTTKLGNQLSKSFGMSVNLPIRPSYQ